MLQTLTHSRARALLAVAGVIALIAVLVLVLRGGSQPPLPLPGIGRPPRPGDPFAYSAARQAEFERRAVAGSNQVLFAKSPGGAIATAGRVARYRNVIDSATVGTGVDPNVLEGIVFLESAGNPNAIAGRDPIAAAGLTQILAQTGQALLGMHVDLRQSRALTARIDAAYAAGDGSAVARLQASRARVDDRFDPRKALAATVRYLKLAQARFGRFDLAVESYHMGIGNLQQVLDRYDGGRAVSYRQLFFDTAPDHHASGYALLHSFSDDSRLYYWRVLGAVQIMHLYRTSPAALVGLAGLETTSPSGADALHPPGVTGSFATPDELRQGYAQRHVLPLPSNPGALGLAYDATMGSLAPRLGQPVALYHGLRPAALDLLIELAARVRTLSGGSAPLRIMSTVADRRYLSLLPLQPAPLTSTGYSFAIERRYVSPRQADALQAMLDQLQALDLIAWVRSPQTIEITVGSDAGRLIVDGV
jgi:Transglycosylase SLT domain